MLLEHAARAAGAGVLAAVTGVDRDHAHALAAACWPRCRPVGAPRAALAAGTRHVDDQAERLVVLGAQREDAEPRRVGEPELEARADPRSVSDRDRVDHAVAHAEHAPARRGRARTRLGRERHDELAAPTPESGATGVTGREKSNTMRVLVGRGPRAHAGERDAPPRWRRAAAPGTAPGRCEQRRERHRDERRRASDERHGCRLGIVDSRPIADRPPVARTAAGGRRPGRRLRSRPSRRSISDQRDSVPRTACCPFARAPAAPRACRLAFASLSIRVNAAARRHRLAAHLLDDVARLRAPPRRRRCRPRRR